jgi:hypothetical protein
VTVPHFFFVIPAQAGIQIPACAGMTVLTVDQSRFAIAQKLFT